MNISETQLKEFLQRKIDKITTLYLLMDNEFCFLAIGWSENDNYRFKTFKEINQTSLLSLLERLNPKAKNKIKNWLIDRRIPLNIQLSN